MIGTPVFTFFAVVCGDPRTWETVFGVASKGVGGGDEAAFFEGVTGITFFEGGLNDVCTYAVDKCG